jgi:hypothetical protein
MSERLLGLSSKSDSVSGVFPGTVGVTYTARLRVRVLATLKTYTGGSTVQQYVNDGGVAADDDYDIAKLEISNPAKTYYLNSGTSGTPPGRVFIDYMLTVQAVGGATFTVSVDSIDEATLYDIAIGDPSTEDASNDATDEEAGIFCQVDYDSGEILETFAETKDGGVRGFSMLAFAENVLTQTEK